MRGVPHALTIIISSRPSDPGDPNSPEGEQSGLLVSSFNTVTLSPKPFVSFNIKVPSRTYNAIQASGKFTASGIGNPRTASSFVNGSDPGWKGMVGTDGKLKPGMGGLWWMRCSWTRQNSVQIGDHVIVVGIVQEARRYGDSASAEDRSLVYAGGKYWRLGEIASDEGDRPRSDR